MAAKYKSGLITNPTIANLLSFVFFLERRAQSAFCNERTRSRHILIREGATRDCRGIGFDDVARGNQGPLPGLLRSGEIYRVHHSIDDYTSAEYSEDVTTG